MSDARVPYSVAGDGIRVAVKVTPKASRDRIGDIFTDADGRSVLKVSVTAAPDRGKANDAVIRLLAKAWGAPKSSFSVISGAKNRRKMLLLTGDAPGFEARLRDWLDGRDG